ncbi:MAG: hypothetical protein D6794_12225, partial [Deltaproteobacteria bacterium]
MLPPGKWFEGTRALCVDGKKAQSPEKLRLMCLSVCYGCVVAVGCRVMVGVGVRGVAVGRRVMVGV